MDKMQALQSFWGSFGIQAYDENTVPDDASYPYITYEASSDNIDSTLALSASLWYWSRSWADISQKADAIAMYIGYGGVTKPIDNGIMWIKRGTPFSQRMGDEESNIRRILLSIEVEFLTEN